MCFGNKVTPSPSYQGQSTSTSTSYSPWASQAAQSEVGNAQAITAANPAQAYNGPSTAAFGSGFGQANNYLSGQLGQTNPYTVQGAGALQGLIGSIDPNATVSSYMSPYVQAALTPTLQNLGITAGQQQQQIAGNATMSGNYGGTAQGVQQALQNNYTQQNVTNATGTAYDKAYGSALQNMLGNRNLLSNAGTGLSNVGQSAFGQGTTLASLLAGLGSTQQQAGQTGINTSISMANQQALLPGQQQGQLSNIISSLAPIGGTNSLSSSQGYGQQPATKNYSGYSMLGSLLSGLI